MTEIVTVHELSIDVVSNAETKLLEFWQQLPLNGVSCDVAYIRFQYTASFEASVMTSGDE